MNVLLELPHDYAVEAYAELPIGRPDGQVFEFSPGLRARERSMCLIHMRPGVRADWTGRFVGDYDEPPRFRWSRAVLIRPRCASFALEEAMSSIQSDPTSSTWWTVSRFVQ